MEQAQVESALDGHKMHLHPDKVAELLRTGDTTPIHVEIGVTGRCNHKCVFCAVDYVKHPKDINTDVMVNALRDMASKGVRSVMYCGEGEPTLHKDLPLFVKKAKEFGMDVGLTSHGGLFKGEIAKTCLHNLSFVKFSVDSGNAETYNKVHRVGEKFFEKLMDNIKNAVDYRNEHNLKCVIGCQFLMIPQSVDSLQEAIDRLTGLGVDYIVFKPYSQHPLSDNRFVIDSELYEKVKEVLRKQEHGHTKLVFREETISRVSHGMPYPKCYGLPLISLIDSTGDILPCNLFHDKPDFTYGNLYDNNFGDIWASDKRKQVLARIQVMGTKECRRGCRCDSGNVYLDRLKNPSGHDNFT